MHKNFVINMKIKKLISKVLNRYKSQYKNCKIQEITKIF